MDIKVREVEAEEKSSQQIEQELLDKHEEQQEVEATESVASDTQCFELNYNQDSRLCPDCSQATEQDPYSMEWWCHSCQKFETEEVMKQFKI